MNCLSPSILSADYTILGEQIRTMDEAGAQYVHIDVMDGQFVPSISIGLPVIKTIRKCTDRIFDVHLMIEEPIRYIDEFAEAGARFHKGKGHNSRSGLKSCNTLISNRVCASKAGYGACNDSKSGLWRAEAYTIYCG